MATHTICVLGGTGFVGRRTVARLVRGNHNIKVLTRTRERNRDLLVLPTVDVVRTDVHNADSLLRAFEDCDVVINLTGILNEGKREGTRFRDVHVELTRKVIAACNGSGVERYLHMSALRADAEGGPSEYLRTKGEAEQLLRREAGDVAVTIFQPSVIFGPEDSFFNRFAAMLRLPSYVFMLPSPNARFAPVYVGDVVEAFAQSIGARETFGKTYELCGPRVYSLREIIGYIQTTLGLKRQVVGLSDGLSKVIARILEFFPGKPMSLDNYLSLKVHSICDQNGFALLDITPTAVETIVPRYLDNRFQRARLHEFRKSARR